MRRKLTTVQVKSRILAERKKQLLHYIGALSKTEEDKIMQLKKQI